MMLRKRVNNMTNLILDVACGPKMFWFDKQHPDALYCDIRKADFVVCDGRKISVDPDMLCDYKSLPFDDNSFKIVVFDPPHLIRGEDNSWLVQKYGRLPISWQEDLQQGFAECMRVLASYGVLVFKWNETQIKVGEIIAAVGHEPLIGHKSGKAMNTHWMLFMKCGDRL